MLVIFQHRNAYDQEETDDDECGFAVSLHGNCYSLFSRIELVKMFKFQNTPKIPGQIFPMLSERPACNGQ